MRTVPDSTLPRPFSVVTTAGTSVHPHLFSQCSSYSVCLSVCVCPCVCLSVYLRENSSPPLNLPLPPALSDQGSSCLGKPSMGSQPPACPPTLESRAVLAKGPSDTSPLPSSASSSVWPDSSSAPLQVPDARPSLPTHLSPSPPPPWRRSRWVTSYKRVVDQLQTGIWRFWPLGLRQARKYRNMG